MGLWEDIRGAIRTKAQADMDSGRQATLGRRARALRGLPQVFVGIPTLGDVERPQAYTERYTLTFPGSIDVGTPAGEQRADAALADLARELQVAWRSGTKLGLASQVEDSWIASMSPEYEDDLLVGYQVVWIVRVLETLSSARSVT